MCAAVATVTPTRRRLWRRLRLAVHRWHLDVLLKHAERDYQMHEWERRQLDLQLPADRREIDRLRIAKIDADKEC
jgi:hypothetical protein